MLENKKILLTILLVLILLIIPNLVLAEGELFATTEINGVTANWQYNLNESNQIIKLKCINPTSLTGNITIPSELDGKTVIQLGNEAFKGATNITGATIPSSIKEIGYSAFENCTNLSKVNLGSIETISIDVFKGCTSLKSITIPKTLKDTGLGDSLNNSNITSITFEEGLTVIPNYLCGNTGITEATIPSSVKSIGIGAFRNCKSLKKITILDNVTSISPEVFKNHNEDLTIYCYKDSEAAKYAIENDIKYVYLTRPETLPLKEIVIEKVANKVDYKVGEKFDKTGMIVKAVYEDGTSKQIENYSINPNTALKLSDTKVTISYTENGVTKEATHKIRVINSSGKVENIDNTTAPGEMPYTGGTFFIILTVIGIATVAIYVYKRNNDLRGI